MMYKISVIIPVYNVALFLPDCIRCLKNQTYKNFEAIFIDDGSTDESGDVLDENCRLDERFKVVHQKNGGASRARNKGLEICKGDYICFVDSDDFIASNYLEILLTTIVKNECDIVQCQYIEVKNRVIPTVLTEKKKEKDLICVSNVEMLERIYTKDNVPTVVLWNKIYKAKVLRGMKFYEGIMFEDELFSVEVIYNANKIGIIPVPLYYYYHNDEGVMNKEYSLKKLDILKALELRMEFYNKNGLEELYQKDSYKYLYKILQNYYHINNKLENSKMIKKKIMKFYWRKYKETVKFQWSIKRKIAMFCFGVFPLAYSKFRKV